MASRISFWSILVKATMDRISNSTDSDGDTVQVQVGNNNLVKLPTSITTDCEKSILYGEPALRSRKRQIFAAIAANLGGFALGTVLSWTSPALPSLRADNVTFPFGLSMDEASWIGSVMPLGAAVGGPIGGYLTDAVGRTTCMSILTFPFMVGWVAIYLAYSVPVIVVGRFLTGVCAGAFSLVAPIFVGEISEPSIRGYLAAGFELMVCIGILFINLLGAYTSWRIQALASALVPVSIFFLMLFIPESPRYLLSKGWGVQAGKALAWFRGCSTYDNYGHGDDQLNMELLQLEEDLRNLAARKGAGAGTYGLRNLFHRRTLLPFSIALCLVVCNELSAIDVVTFYTVDLFESAGVTIDSYHSTIVVAVVNIIGAAVAAVVVDKCGRRFLLLLSQTLVTLSLGMFALFFVLREYQEEFTLTYLAYLPLISLIVYAFAYVVGLGTVIYLIMGEILPYSTKGLTSGTITVCKWVLGFGITKSFEDLRLLLGDAGVFGLFTGCCLFGLWYTALFVPETNGRTLEEIQNLFTGHGHARGAGYKYNGETGLLKPRGSRGKADEEAFIYEQNSKNYDAISSKL